mmetsp:Transcript_2128/g.6954  ORF Transcript_2128/g.6954 Transcript_2128/m.6954 type:complete len:283 (+) Transcript_2128:381-1229(+)
MPPPGAGDCVLELKKPDTEPPEMERPSAGGAIAPAPAPSTSMLPCETPPTPEPSSGKSASSSHCVRSMGPTASIGVSPPSPTVWKDVISSLGNSPPYGAGTAPAAPPDAPPVHCGSAFAGASVAAAVPATRARADSAPDSSESLATCARRRFGATDADDDVTDALELIDARRDDARDLRPAPPDAFFPPRGAFLATAGAGFDAAAPPSSSLGSSSPSMSSSSPPFATPALASVNPAPAIASGATFCRMPSTALSCVVSAATCARSVDTSPFSSSKSECSGAT